MIQRVNGVDTPLTVASWPDYMEVNGALRDKLPLNLIVARYSDCVESASVFELVDIRNLRPTTAGFCYSGSIASTVFDTETEEDHRLLLFVTAGFAKVSVDQIGAKLEYSIMISLHEM